MSIKQQYINAIVLSASGDALGWMTEFYSDPKQLNKKFGTSQITTFLNWDRFCGNRYNGYKDIITSGSYSDDTQLMLAVARSIRSFDSCDHDYFAKIELPCWLDYKRGAGIMTTEAARKIQRCSAQWSNNFFTRKTHNYVIDYRDGGGNGAAMRVLPICLAFANNDILAMLKEIFCNSIITHGHPRAIIGAMLYGIIIYTIIHNRLFGLSLLTYIGQHLCDLLTTALNYIITSSHDMEEWLVQWEATGRDFRDEYQIVIQECLAMLRKGYVVLKNNKDMMSLFHDIGVFDSVSKGSGVVSVICAFICFCNETINCLHDGMVFVVNLLGADTDSIAAFYGAMVGISIESDIACNYHGVQDYDYLLKVGTYLYHISTKQQYLGNPLFNVFSEQYIDEKCDYFNKSLGLGNIVKSQEINTLTPNLLVIRKDVKFLIGQTASIILRVRKI